jgi:hypothetical protein
LGVTLITPLLVSSSSTAHPVLNILSFKQLFEIETSPFLNIWGSLSDESAPQRKNNINIIKLGKKKKKKPM